MENALRGQEEIGHSIPMQTGIAQRIEAKTLFLPFPDCINGKA
jgi:hypothetical protein